jgi:monoamine oxidase
MAHAGGAEPPPATEGEIYDVLVLGAGVAGLSAAHALLENDLDVLVVEGRDRLGGRTWTDRSFAAFPLELGAEFIHGERAATWAWVDRLGLKTAPWEKQDDSWVRMADGRRLTMREARALDPAFDLTRSWELPDVSAWPNEDFGGYLRRVGFDRDQLDYVRRAFANAAGESLRHLDARSVLDGFEARELDGRKDVRILEGYGAIVEALGVGLDIDTGRTVRRVYWGPAGVTVETEGGPVYNARAAVVTLPVGVLHSGAVRFAPELPEGKVRALAGLRMGRRTAARGERSCGPPWRRATRRWRCSDAARPARSSADSTRSGPRSTESLPSRSTPCW